MKAVLILTVAILLSAPVDNAAAAEPRVVDRLIGYTELQTDLPGGRHANVRTSRAVVMQADGQSVFYTAKVGDNVELFRVMLDGEITPLTKTPTGSLHYHPTPSPDGKQLLYGSKRDGVRQLFVMNSADRSERQLTDLQPGRAAMWLHWQPVACTD